MEQCPVCKKYYKSINIHFSKNSNIEHNEYLNKVIERIDYYLLNSTYYINEISDVINTQDKLVCYSSLVYKRENEICPGRGYEIMAIRRTGKDNPVFKDGVIEKISDSVASKWRNGVYKNRINGMLNKKGIDNPKFNVYKFLKNRYRDIYNYFHNDNNKCLIDGCNKPVQNIHHIDEDHDNFHLTNLEGYCVFHHMDRHYGSRKTPYVTITKIITFDSSHKLLNYNGKCKNLHGHTYKIEVSLRNRVNLQTDMVIDFGILKQVINDYVIEPLDHKYLNDEILLFNPTAENMLSWIWERLEKDALIKGLIEIRLWETPTSVVSLERIGMFLSPLYAMSYYNELTKHYNWDVS